MLKNGEINYQIKADDSFKSLSDGAILKELFGQYKGEKVKDLKNLTSEKAKKRLKPKIKETMDKNNYYILVSFRTDRTDKQNRVEFIKKALQKCGYNEPKVDIIDATNLEAYINQYPSIVSQLINLPDRVYTVAEALTWERLNEPYYITPELAEVESKFKLFYEEDQCRHIRVLAEPGTGKTKSVLEFCKNYNAVTLYVEKADGFDDSQLYSFLKNNKHIFLVLILDECSLETSQYIWNKFKNIVPNLKLITIYNDFKQDTSDTDTQIINLPKLSEEDFANILIEKYNMNKSVASHISTFCDGSPRLAHYIGKNYEAEQKVLDNLDDVLTGVVMGSNSDEELKNKVMCILRYFSLFKKFGFSEIYEDERNFIFNLIKLELPELTTIELDTIVRKLKFKKILQQEHTLYISPKILHIWLYGQFWTNLSRKKQIFYNLETFPKNLKKWFGEMFEYASNAQLSVDIPKELLKRFSYEDFLDRGRSDFFFSLTKANPKEALKTLAQIFNEISDEQIKNMVETRMNLVWALQYILFNDELFAGAIKILFKLAENETETRYSNNSTGIFRQMFHVSLPGTEASLEKRAKILADLYKNTKTKNGVLLLVKAFDSALTTDHFTRIGGVENQGFKVRNDYNPKTYGEIFDYWACIFKLLIDCTENQTDEEILNLATHAIYHNATSHLKYSDATQNKIFEVFDTLKQSDKIDKTELWLEILKTIKLLKYSKGMPLVDKAIAHFEKMKDSLAENRPKESIESFFDVDIWKVIDERKDVCEEFITKISGFYKDLCSKISKEERKNFLKKLITSNYKNEYFFGIMVAKNDANYELLNDAIAFYSDSEHKDSLFLVGYLAEVYKTSKDVYDETVKKLYEMQLFDLVININCRAFPTEITSKLAFEAIKTRKVPLQKINTFVWASKDMPVDVIKNILEFAISEGTLETIKSAINILYHNKEKLWLKENYNLIFKVLNSAVLVKKDNKATLLIDDDYIWSSVLGKFVDLQGDSDEVFLLFEKLIIYMTQREASDLRFSQYVQSLLSKFADINPKKTWNCISKYLKRETIIFSPIQDWLRGDDNFEHDTLGAMAKFSIDDIFNWIDEDKETRLEIIAYCAPKDLFRLDSNIMRSLLVKYGKSEELRSFLSINLGNKGLIGKVSDNIKREISQAESSLKGETDFNVISFINNHIESLKSDLKREIIREERSDY